MTLLSLIGHQAKVTNCIRSRFCKYKPGCGVSHNSNHRAAELVTRAIPQLSQETEHFCRSVNKSCEDCPVWAAAANKLTRLEETQHFCGWGQKKVAKIVQCGEALIPYQILEKDRCEAALSFSGVILKRVQCKLSGVP